ncbi:hypothetical protein [Paraferrimonas sedimenticola]|uniref:Lipoprotein n=1 Tax=Paraferrimonas sedimenticola TaxID=375674 RepID=A0AA37VUY8_9GAMM|nr:hypothetical protein [Paraferrimonas sedimenticola]GLP95964.1 hypothetical protein GCM10007895_12700 [Paraferrimonas sedimenticola]
MKKVTTAALMIFILSACGGEEAVTENWVEVSPNNWKLGPLNETVLPQNPALSPYQEMQGNSFNHYGYSTDQRHLYNHYRYTESLDQQTRTRTYMIEQLPFGLRYVSTFTSDLAPTIHSVEAQEDGYLSVRDHRDSTILECNPPERTFNHTECVHAGSQLHIITDITHRPAPPSMVEKPDPLKGTDLANGEHTIRLLNYYLGELGIEWL